MYRIMCHFDTDRSEAVEMERELRGEYVVVEDETESVETEEPSLLADGGEK